MKLRKSIYLIYTTINNENSLFIFPVSIMCVDRYGVLATATNLQFTRGIVLPVFHKYGESKTKSDCQEQCLHYASKKRV